MRALTFPIAGGATRCRSALLAKHSTDCISDFPDDFSDISEFSFATLLDMSSNEREKGPETLGEAAARLLGRLEAQRNGRPPAERAGEIQTNVIKLCERRRAGGGAASLSPLCCATTNSQARRR